MKLQYAKNPYWADANKTVLNLTVCWEEWPTQEMPFSATADDVEAHGRALFERAVAGDFGEISEYIPPAPPSYEEQAGRIRQDRAVRLAQTDWTQLPDVPQSTKDMWAPYRQALRDVPLQPGFPNDVVWPVPPA